MTEAKRVKIQKAIQSIVDITHYFYTNSEFYTINELARFANKQLKKNRK